MREFVCECAVVSVSFPAYSDISMRYIHTFETFKVMSATQAAKVAKTITNTATAALLACCIIVDFWEMNPPRTCQKGTRLENKLKIIKFLNVPIMRAMTPQ